MNKIIKNSTLKKTKPKFVQGLELSPFMSEENVPVIEKETSLGKLKFWGFGATSEFRVRTLLTKEPETIEWINSFDKNSLFWDIGANIGCYSLYASLKAKKVIAFEPSAFNYFLLNKNIHLNQVNSKVESYNIAFSDENGLDSFYLSSEESAGAENSFGIKEDAYGNKMEVAYRQTCIGWSIDDFISQYKLPIPNYIKIDVDGIEPLIIKGAAKTFMNRGLKSVLIEVNEFKTDEISFICSFMKKNSFNKVTKRHAPDFDDSYYKPFFNYIFFRD